MSDVTLNLANDVLCLYGLAPVQNIKDSAVASLVASALPLFYKKLLSTQNWAFALKRLRLSEVPLSDNDKYPYPYAYAIPWDLVRLSSVSDRVGIKRRGNLYLSRYRPLTIEYISFEVSYQLLPSYFRMALAYFIAMNLCDQVTQNLRLRELLTHDYEHYYSEAVAQNEMESV